MVIGGSNTEADFPGLAISPQAIYVTTNQYRFSDFAFMDARLFIINKNGLTFTVQDPAPTSIDLTLQPANIHDATWGGSRWRTACQRWRSDAGRHSGCGQQEQGSIDSPL